MCDLLAVSFNAYITLALTTSNEFAIFDSIRFMVSISFAKPPLLNPLPAHTTKTKFKDTILFCSHPKKVDVVTPRLFDAPTPSTEITAVAWVLETSTDPHTLRIAAEMAVNLQWPMATDPRPHLSRLLDSFFGCFDSSVIFDSKTQSQRRLLTSLRDGMHSHAIHFGRAYCSLRCLQSFETDANSEHFTGADFELGPGLPNELELENVFSILRGWPYLIISPAPHFQPALKWALHVIPSIPHPQGRSRSLHSFLEQFDQAIPRLNLQCFSDYLFCLICYMSSTTNNHDILLMNKSEYAAQLYEDLLKTLLANLHTGRISMYQGAYIVTTTGRLWVEHIQDYHSTVFRPAQSSMFAFCESLPRKEGWLNVVAAAGIFIQDCSEERFRGSSSVIPQSLIQNWAHDALALQRLGHLGDPYTATGIAGLFNALLSYGCSPGVESRPLIVKSLSMPGHISQNATRLLLKEDFTKWFQDEDASPILQRASIWTFLTRNALRDPAIVGVYIELGRTLLGIPAPWQVHMNNTPDYSREWHSLLHAEFSCDWITIFFRSNWQVHPWHWDEGTSLLNTNTSYIEVLHEIWQPDLGRCPFALDHAQRACGLSLVVLFKLWTDFDFRTESNSVVSLLRSTSWTALRPSSSFITNENNADFEQVYFIPLRDRLIQTGTTLGIQFETDDCSEDTSVERKVPNEILRWIVAILEDLARRIPINLGPVWRHEYHVYWRNLRWEFDASLDELEKALQPWISLDPQVIDKRPFRVPLPESSRGDGSNSSVSTHSYVSFP
ncbi:hypothetical protein C8R43DRAFT_523279 [Mycena crocata]|nr:hypothetical protein C8R43DRAFT_523279 [Mycena crocata]